MPGNEETLGKCHEVHSKDLKDKHNDKHMGNTQTKTRMSECLVDVWLVSMFQNNDII